MLSKIKLGNVYTEVFQDNLHLLCMCALGKRMLD